VIKQLKSLKQREIILLAGGGGSLLLILMYLFIWKPLVLESVSIENRIKQLEWSLVEIKYLQKIKPNNVQNTPQQQQNNKPLVVVIDGVLRKYNLYNNLQRSQPIGENSIRIELNETKFNDLIASLDELQNNYNMNVDTVNISLAQTNQDGAINASITLIRN
jgi:type II secretory pathway component PulM